MKKFTKVCLIIALILGIVGGGLFVTGVAMGASWQAVKNTAGSWVWEHWNWDRDWDDWHDRDWYVDDEDYWDISNMDVIKSSLTKEPLKEYEFPADEVVNLDVEAKRAYVLIKESSRKDTIRVSVYSSRDEVKLDRDYATLSVEREGRHRSDDKKPIQIEIPSGMQFSEADINVGAGVLEMGSMESAAMSLGAGGGEMNVSGTLKADSMELNCGMGSMEIARADCRYAEINCGMGNVDALFEGRAEEYRAQVECGIGNVNLGDENYSGISSVSTGLSDAPGFIQVECGMGNVNIRFDK